MELLAPAGSISALKCAIHNGADAVYLGLGELNARSKCTDFTVDSLVQWVEYCHLYGAKVYVTVNTSVKNSELDRVKSIVSSIQKANADAVIACDLATIKAVIEESDLPLHISTQSGVHDFYSAKFYQQLGTSRVVLARECYPDDIKAVKQTGLEVETFVHGALCVSSSGGCLMSSMAFGLSGNRGKCLQLCRKEYYCPEYGNKGYLLSAKDFCLIHRLSELKELGVDSLKIEGRNRRPEYSGIVTACYRQALDNNLSARELDLIIYDMQKVFYRGYTSGYDIDKRIINSQCQNHVGVPIGKIVSTEQIKGFNFAYVKSNYQIAKGDGLKILSKGKDVGGSDVTSVAQEKGLQKIPVSEGVKEGFDVNLTSCQQQLKIVLDRKKKIEVDFLLDLQGEKATLLAKTKNISVRVEGETLGEANVEFPLRAKTQISKCGNTPFEAKEVQILGNKTLKISSINLLRRTALELLEKKIVADYNRFSREKTSINLPCRKAKLSGDIIEINSLDQLSVINKCDNLVFLPKSISHSYLKRQIESLREKGFDPYVKLPRFMHSKDFELVKDLFILKKVKLVAESNAIVEFARENNLSYIAGMGLNVYNENALAFYNDADAIVISLEVGLSNDLEKYSPYVFVYGNLPLMTLLHCPHRESGKSESCSNCKQKGKSITYVDDGKRRFKILPTTSDNGCVFTLYNQSLTEIKNTGRFNRYLSMIGVDLSCKSKNQGFVNKEVL